MLWSQCAERNLRNKYTRAWTLMNDFFTIGMQSALIYDKYTLKRGHIFYSVLLTRIRIKFCIWIRIQLQSADPDITTLKLVQKIKIYCKRRNLLGKLKFLHAFSHVLYCSFIILGEIPFLFGRIFVQYAHSESLYNFHKLWNKKGNEKFGTIP